MVPTVRPGDEVVVEPVAADELVPGDWVIVHHAGQGFLHRYLGRRRGGLLTKGDHHWAPDPLWAPENLLGRAVEVWRGGTCYYRRQPRRIAKERMVTHGHRWIARIWSVLHRIKGWLFISLMLALALLAPAVWAAVTIADFTAEGGEQEVFVYWETASETDNLGFFIWRSEAADGEYFKLPLGVPESEQIVYSADSPAGWFYEFEDVQVTPGVLYYYKLQDVPANNPQAGDIFGPVAAGAGVDTPTPTPTPTNTPTPTPTNTPEPGVTPQPTSPPPTNTPVASVRFWASETQFPAGECSTVQWQASAVSAVYFNGSPVAGQDARTFCPCEDTIYTLRVVYRDNTSEDFTLTLDVSGTCTEEQRAATATPNPSALATPTRRPTRTPVPTSTSLPDQPTATPQPTRTPTPSPSRTPREAGATASEDSPLATPTAAASVTPSATAEPAAGEASVDGAATPLALVEGQAPASRSASSTVWMLLGGVLGAGLIGGGFWLWRRHEG